MDWLIEAANALSIRAAMFAYLGAGFSVIPLRGKQAATKWVVFQTQRPSSQDIILWQNQGLLSNIGIVCGRVSGNLVVIDCDGEYAEREFSETFPYLLNTYTVRTGSGGLHVYLEVDDLPYNRKISFGEGHSGLEIRGNGQYVVAPPSIHPNTLSIYKIESQRPVLRVLSIVEVGEWLDSYEPQQKPVQRENKKPSIEDGSRSVQLRDRNGEIVRNPKAYARIALQDECYRVLRASTNRNDGLYAAAQRMAQLIGMGLLSESEVESALVNAARGWTDGDNERQIRATIQSGYRSEAAKETR